MKIAQFISHFLYKTQFEDPDWIKNYVCTGGEYASYNLINNLVMNGHEVSVFTSSHNNQDMVETYDGIKIYRYASIGQVGETKFSPKLFWKPIDLIKDFDIIHIQHTTPPGGMAGLTCNHWVKKPLIVTHHGFERPDNFGNIVRRLSVNFSANYYVDFLLKQATAIICISPTFINSSRFLKKYSQKVFSIPNGVNTEEYDSKISREDCRKLVNLPQENPIVLFVGSLIPFKGVDFLIEAMPIVSQKFPDVIAVLVGRGPQEEQIKLEQKVKSLGLENRIQFKGFIARSELKSYYYRSADVLVIPSSTEMFPLVLLEGAASGSSIVLSNLETFRSIIKDHESGIFVTVGDPNSIASGIIEVLQSQELKSKLSRSAQEMSKRYSWYAIAQETERLYKHIIDSQV